MRYDGHSKFGQRIAEIAILPARARGATLAAVPKPLLVQFSNPSPRAALPRVPVGRGIGVLGPDLIGQGVGFGKEETDKMISRHKTLALLLGVVMFALTPFSVAAAPRATS